MKESGAEREAYNRLRPEFDELAIEDKPIFLLEATVTTLMRGIESFGRMVGDELERIMRRAEAEAARADDVEPEGTPAANVTPEGAATTPTPPDTDIPGP